MRLIENVGTTETGDIDIRFTNKQGSFPKTKYTQVLVKHCTAESAHQEEKMAYGYEIAAETIRLLVKKLPNLGSLSLDYRIDCLKQARRIIKLEDYYHLIVDILVEAIPKNPLM